MKYELVRYANTDVHVFTFDPLKNRSQVTIGEGGRKEPLSKIRHLWFDANGYKTIAKVNFGFFDMTTDLNEHIGILMHDQGFAAVSCPDEGMECYLTTDGEFVVEELDWDRAEQIKDSVLWGGSLSYALVIDGQKNIQKAWNFPHYKYKNSRTFIGQDRNGQMILAVADKGPGSAGLTADEQAEFMIRLGAITAINADGGGSSEMIYMHQIKNKPDDGNERRIGSALLVFDKEEEQSVVAYEKVDGIFDPGHGGRDPGGSGYKLFSEKDKVLQISLYQQKRMKDHGLNFLITRESDVTLEENDRVNIVKNSGAAICISNHTNAFNKSARGIETIHSIYSDGFLAKRIADALKNTGLLPLRRVFTRTGADGKDYYFMHRRTGAVETVIVEYGFGDNDQDAAVLDTQWQTLAEAVIEAVVTYLGKTYDGGPKAAPAPSTMPEGYPAGAKEYEISAMEWAFENKLLDDPKWKSLMHSPVPLWVQADMMRDLYNLIKKG